MDVSGAFSGEFVACSILVKSAGSAADRNNGVILTSNEDTSGIRAG